MRTDLRHKVVCITGAAGGIGRAIAEAFAREGARLALIDVNSAKLEELAAARFSRKEESLHEYSRSHTTEAVRGDISPNSPTGSVLAIW